MTAENRLSAAFISPVAIEAAMNRARQERAEAMRAALVGLVALAKRLAAALRPTRQRPPQAGAWAR